MSTSPPDGRMVTDSGADPRANRETTQPDSNSNVPKPKRLACILCRKRKLRCDGIKPSCSTCTRLGHSCAYDEVRRKSGPKRGYVKALEERLKQVETLLKTQEPPAAAANNNNHNSNHDSPVDGIPRAMSTPSRSGGLPKINENAAPTANFNVNDPPIGITNSRDMDRWHFNGDTSPQPGSIDNFDFSSTMNMQNNTWEMIGLGLEEPLPPQESIDELHQVFFDKVHPSMPMIHRYRYLAAMNLSPSQRPPVCLRYAVWTLACSVSDKYASLKDLFYQRARKYVELDYVKGFGEHLISVAHAQTHVLLSQYEFKMMYFPRAWMSTGSAVRLCQMMGLHRVDGAGLDVKQCLPPPRDWTEKEERRRTFWMAFAEDRYASIGTGWPMTIDEKDIMTHMPSTDEAFDMSRPEQTETLGDSMCPAGAGKLSSLGGIVLMACLFGRNLIHLHRPDVDDKDHDLNGEFWKRHRTMDNILLNTSLCLPPHLKLPTGLGSPNIVFTNMCIHTSTICLHQAAIFKADKNRLPASVSAESKVRCITAANEIASTMRMISHMDLSMMNPFISFCLYVAARVFVQYLKSRPEDGQTADSLRFLLAAMNALKRMNPLTESFLVQLDVDLEALGTRIPKLKTAFPRSDSQNGPKWPGQDNTPPGAPCDGKEPRAHGIMAYRNDCTFTKVSDDNGAPVGGPDIVDSDPNLNSNHVKPSFPPNIDNLGPSAWGTDASMSYIYRQPSTGGTPEGFHLTPDIMGGRVLSSGFVNSDSGGTGDMSTSPDGAQSDRPTPNSSTTSDRHQNSSNNLAAPTGQHPSGRNSFEASPASSHQTLNNGRQSSGDSAENVAAFQFGDLPGGFGSTGITPDNRFAMPETPGGNGGGMGGGDFSSWDSLNSHATTAMTPGTEGVLRTIMQMGPMETMDLGWDTNS